MYGCICSWYGSNLSRDILKKILILRLELNCVIYVSINGVNQVEKIIPTQTF